MSTTSASTATHTPRPTEASARPAQDSARAARDKPSADIFSSLLDLFSSTHLAPETAALAPTQAPGSSPDGPAHPDGDDNPLASWPGWVVPGTVDALAGKGTGPSGTGADPAMASLAGATDRTAASRQDGQLDISGMTAVDAPGLELAPKGAVALPANALRPGAASTTLARATEAAPGGLPAMTWRHASLASTETGAIQQAGAQALNLRSTVALNDRFGATPGVPLSGAEPRDATTEGVGLATPTSAASRAPEAAGTLPTTAAGDSGTGSGGTGTDTGASEQNPAGADPALAHADSGEEPTVTHWGSQHLRHASLRVAGEAGEQGIDIQLSMQGQEVQVAFTTENADTRASLRENAGTSLAELLNKSGIQLGGVSVGAHGQPGSRGEGGAQRPRGVASVGNTPAAEPTRPLRSAPRADGSQPLDVFA